MSIPPCSLHVWKNLYDAAEAFREIACWKWMSDSDLFGVKDPETGEIGYCCVLGELGEVYGLVVYLGSPGLAQHQKIQSGKTHAGSPEFVYNQCCLTAWFGSRNDLDKTDLKVIRTLNRNFRGSNAWPQYRSLRPGYLPWYLTENEAKFLTLCLEQALEVALLFAEDPDCLTPPGKNFYFVRVASNDPRAVTHSPSFNLSPQQQMLFPRAAENRSDRWHSQWLNPAPIALTPVNPFPIDEIRLQRIKNNSHANPGVWEIDGFYTPTPVEGGDRPFFPYAYLCTEHDSGLILGTVLAEPSTWTTEFPRAFLDSIEQHKLLPCKVSVRKKELWDLFAPLTAHLGIEAELNKKLPSLDRAKRELLKFVKKQG